jgi:hypothetical protein
MFYIYFTEREVVMKKIILIMFVVYSKTVMARAENLANQSCIYFDGKKSQQIPFVKNQIGNGFMEAKVSDDIKVTVGHTYTWAFVIHRMTLSYKNGEFTTADIKHINYNDSSLFSLAVNATVKEVRINCMYDIQTQNSL